jgi:hypothetical protein
MRARHLVGDAGRRSRYPVRVFAIRGVGGMLFSRGMNALCDELAEFASVTCTVRDFTEVTAIESKVRAASAAVKALAGSLWINVSVQN